MASCLKKYEGIIDLSNIVNAFCVEWSKKLYLNCGMI